MIDIRISKISLWMKGGTIKPTSVSLKCGSLVATLAGNFDVMDAYTENTFIVAAVSAAFFVWGMVTGKAFGRPSWMMDRSKSPNYFWVFQIFWATAAIICAAIGFWHLL